MVTANLLTRIGPLDDELEQVGQRLTASVVTVQTGNGGGAGVIWSTDGLIVTNDHVARGDTTMVVLPNGERLAGRVIARDRTNDLAALRIARDGLPALTAGDSRALRVGQLVLAVGHPLGVEHALTAGIVSGLPEVDGSRELIRADVAIGPGNSGGPLADAAGRVIGINAMVAAPGVALAVPAHVVESFLAIAAGPLPYLGIEAQVVELPARYRRRLALAVPAALMITGVAPASPAQEAGLLPGDLILSAGGHPAWDPGQLRGTLALTGPGGTLRLTLLRGGTRLDAAVRLGPARETQQERAA